MDSSITQHKYYEHLAKQWQRSKQDHLDISGFSSFEEFFKWSLQNGFEPGMILLRRNETFPFSPKNGAWRWRVPSKQKYDKEVQKSIDLFDKTVARIRAAYNLSPINAVQEGCEISDTEKV